jgi:hypothetical protein
MPSRFDRYLAHLERLTGGAEPTLHTIEPHLPDLEPIIALTYQDLPKAGCLTGGTYGLSLTDHDDWQEGRPDLCITVRPADLFWVLRVGRMAEVLRGRCSFRHGLAIWDMNEPDLPMKGFVVNGPAFLNKQGFLPIDLNPSDSEERDIVNLAGCYPIHRAERDFINDNGLPAFWDLEWDRLDVTRPPAL